MSMNKIRQGMVVDFDEPTLKIRLRGKVLMAIEANMKPHIKVQYKMTKGPYPRNSLVKHRTYLVGVGLRMWRLDDADLRPVDFAVELARKISDYVNGIGNKLEDVIDPMARDHRTLQQGFTKLCVAWLERCAKMHDDRDFDGRNEHSAKLGKKFVVMISEQDRILPFI
jgi:hypothetical protein